MGFKFNQRLVGCLYNGCATIASLGCNLPKKVATAIRRFHSHLRLPLPFWLLADSIAWSLLGVKRVMVVLKTMKANQQGESFWLRSSLISLHLAVKMCGVFRNRVSSTSSGGQLRGGTSVCIVLDPLQHPWPTTHKEIPHIWNLYIFQKHRISHIFVFIFLQFISFHWITK